MQFVRALSPHPGPLPRGEGETFGMATRIPALSKMIRFPRPRFRKPRRGCLFIDRRPPPLKILFIFQRRGPAPSGESKPVRRAAEKQKESAVASVLIYKQATPTGFPTSPALHPLQSCGHFEHACFSRARCEPGTARAPKLLPRIHMIDTNVLMACVRNQVFRTDLLPFAGCPKPVKNYCDNTQTKMLDDL